jgi:hypothetical protein
MELTFTNKRNKHFSPTEQIMAKKEQNFSAEEQITIREET